MDPLNLVGAARPTTEGEGWDYAPAGEKVKGERLSDLGHGNVAPNPQHGGVTITSASRMATLSMAGLDRIGFGSASVGASVAAASWAALGVCLLVFLVGASMRLSQWLLDVSPFTHVPKAPGATVSATPLVWLVAIALALAAAGLIGLRRRDIPIT